MLLEMLVGAALLGNDRERKQISLTDAYSGQLHHLAVEEIEKIEAWKGGSKVRLLNGSNYFVRETVEEVRRAK